MSSDEVAKSTTEDLHRRLWRALYEELCVGRYSETEFQIAEDTATRLTTVVLRALSIDLTERDLKTNE